MTPSYDDLYWNSSDGLRLHARDHAPAAGQPPRGTVVCIPGLTRNAADFDALARSLTAAGWRVIAVDLRGRARSARAPDPSGYNPRAYADDMVALLQSQNIDKAVFIGTSLGVLVTITLASRAPDRIAAAVLNDAGPKVPREALARIGKYAGKPVPPMDLAQATAYVESIGKAAFPRFTADDWRTMATNTFRQRDDGLLELDYDPAVIRTTRPWVLWLLRPVLWRAVRGLTARVPVLVVRGALSDILPPDVARKMAATSASARLVEVPEVGHAPTLSEPVARDAILALLADVR
ncbi:alpha/beta hydrolase [Stenotrophomonas sp. HMWF003]|uniref:alpha/beta fold hydrolase n=1 Tax=Stenotrophomonas sp. HMWF003 TaxID=2056840 RepID=UPI000D4C3391|nr:alpha/beta hydrolase [Stenotrophomonas sp. HMWF003]PTT58319.1 alpha/beta hydrolase [Stenotrophomonas sp. HMWF003]